jgi:hypothetical protein
MNLDMETRGIFPLGGTISTLKSSIIALLLMFLLIGCRKGTEDGYKIIGYSQPPSDELPTFTILHNGVKITAKCQNYYGNHIGCDQLATKVGTTIPLEQMGTLVGGSTTLYYKPNRGCEAHDCEFLQVIGRQSLP